MSHLMLIDDDLDVLTLNKKYFEQEGYHVSTFENAPSAIRALSSHRPDCVVLDVMMPGMDGFTALRSIRSKTNAPVIFLTGRDSEDDRINGLLSGAEDYIVKPYSLKELSARIKVQLRRVLPRAATAPTKISYPPISIDLLQHKVFYNDTDEIVLSNREYEFLHLLLTRNGKIITFEEIGNAIWNSYLDTDRKSIMVIASRLRKRLESYSGLENAIETTYGKGYRSTLKREAFHDR